MAKTQKLGREAVPKWDRALSLAPGTGDGRARTQLGAILAQLSGTGPRGWTLSHFREGNPPQDEVDGSEVRNCPEHGEMCVVLFRRIDAPIRRIYTFSPGIS
jgi:hypothetical protein